MSRKSYRRQMVWGAIETGVMKDRKELNITVEANAKVFHGHAANVRYRKLGAAAPRSAAL